MVRSPGVPPSSRTTEDLPGYDHVRLPRRAASGGGEPDPTRRALAPSRLDTPRQDRHFRSSVSPPPLKPLDHGPTRNPWGLDYSVGGSSGGSAAMVAAGVVPSRTPTTAVDRSASRPRCGLGSEAVAWSARGSRGDGPDAGEDRDQGVVTRTVRDTVQFYREMARIHPADHLPPIGPTGDPGRLRIGLLTQGVAGLPVDPRCKTAVESAARLCEDLSRTVEPIDNLFPGPDRAGLPALLAMLAFSLQRFGSQVYGKEYQPKQLEPFTIHLSKFFSSGGRRPARITASPASLRPGLRRGLRGVRRHPVACAGHPTGEDRLHRSGGGSRTPGAAAAVRVLHRPAERVRAPGISHADGHVRARAADRHPRRGALRTGTDAPRSGGRHRAGAALGTDRSVTSSSDRTQEAGHA